MQKFTQKYTVVSFFEPIAEGAEFMMSSWPLHTTLADVFAIPEVTSVYKGFKDLADAHLPINTVVEADMKLGPPESSTLVTLLRKTSELQQFHDAIVAQLESHDATFNTPEYTKSGYLPHVTVQRSGRLTEGQVFILNHIAVIDMFVDGDMKKRKVLRIFSV